MMNTTAALPVVQDPDRLDVLKSLMLLDTPAEAAFDRLTHLAAKIIGTPVSLVSIVDADRQFFKSYFGLPEPWASQRETPLSHSFCQYVVATNEPLVVEDARRDPVLKDNLAIPDLNVIGYLGMPLTTSDGVGLGSFCVIDNKPRRWKPEEIEIVRELAISVMTEIELRAQIQARTQAEKLLEAQNRQLRRVTDWCDTTIEHMAEAIQRGTDMSELKFYVDGARRELNKVLNS
jgi:GAF domain-containing protein